MVLNTVFLDLDNSQVFLLLAACIKCEFLAFASNTLVLEFLNINKVELLSVILSCGSQNNTSQINVAGKIFVV